VKAWPADRVERRAVAGLVPYARNARTHSDAQVAQIAASITEWGWTTPVLVDDAGVLIAGHGRVLAAQRLGLADVPVMVASGWTKAQVAAYRLADNKLALNAGWDDETLKFELAELSLDGFDLDLTGFSEMEIDALSAPDTDAEAEWQGMPEFDQPDNGAFKSLVVHFKDQDAVDSFARLIGQMITAKTKFAWFPPAERERSADKPVWAADAA
jgi:ParB-like chromosome segregation protein Spo0J